MPFDILVFWYSEDCTKDMLSLFHCKSDSRTPRVGLTNLSIHKTDLSDPKPQRNGRQSQCLSACQMHLER